jgi:hypothetical protein
MIVIALALQFLNSARWLQWSVALPLIISAYGFCLATPLAAITGDRGLQPGSKGVARLVYLGNWLGAVGSIVASVCFVLAAFASF